MKARLLVTRRCFRACPGCCNIRIGTPEIPEPRRVSGVRDLLGFDEIMITGGEPMLLMNDPENDPVTSLLAELRAAGYTGRIYLYTAKFKLDALERVLPYLDGIHYTVHAPPPAWSGIPWNAWGRDDVDTAWTDVSDWFDFQCWAAGAKLAFPNLSLRAYLDPRFPLKLELLPGIGWTRLEVKPWIDDGRCPLPAGEELLELAR